jgi:hypothetical protein
LFPEKMERCDQINDEPIGLAAIISWRRLASRQPFKVVEFSPVPNLKNAAADVTKRHRELGRPASSRERLSRQTFLVIDQNEAEWGLLTPYPQHKVQVFGGRTGRKNFSPAGQYGQQR